MEHWNRKGRDQDRVISALERRGLGAVRIHRALVEEFGTAAVSRVTVTRRLREIRERRDYLNTELSRLEREAAQQFYSEHPELLTYVPDWLRQRYSI